MSILSFHDVALEFGDLSILSGAELSIEAGERICLIGRNGAGKSSLMKLITGELQVDHGQIRRKSDLYISQLDQSLPAPGPQRVHDYVGSGLGELRQLIEVYAQRAQSALDQRGLAELEALHRRIDAHGGWNIEQRVATIISELNLPAEQGLDELSGGWRRRVSLAKALVGNPDLLLLDEPTNHLDLSTIQWLENRIFNFTGSVLFVTHDRAFLQRLATRIIELDRGRISSWPGGYREYLANKAKALEDEARQNALFDKKLEQEEAWIRQGVKARRTRNEGRVRGLEAMRETHGQRVKPIATARIHVEEAEQSGRKVIEAFNLTHGYRDERLIEKLSLKITRGERIGLVGNNGVGKSTLLKILLGEITPQAGSVKIGTNLEIGYFDQMRRDLNPDKTVFDTVGDGRDHVRIDGHDRHVIGYLKGFLFSPERAMMPVKALSGGECNRVILARLFTRPTNLLVLDEPTNDLDVETLEVLEERLSEYGGTLIVVSHDRAFLDNVVTSVLVFEEGGKVQHYAGGFSDWLTRGRRLTEVDNPGKGKDTAASPVAAAPRQDPPRGKLSYKFKLELERIPDKIDELEQRLLNLQATTNDAGFYQRPFDQVQATLNEITATQQALDQLLERWTELEEMARTAV